MFFITNILQPDRPEYERNSSILRIIERMIMLFRERGAYIRVGRGVCAKDIERAFGFRAGATFSGAVIPLPKSSGGFCYAQVGDDYRTIAMRTGVDEREIEKLNGGEPVYPSKKIWLP